MDRALKVFALFPLLWSVLLSMMLMNRGIVLTGATVLDSGVLMEGSGLSGPVLALPIKIKEGQKAYRRRTGVHGRLELIQETQLKPGYGTHFIYLYIGTPPQRVSVIVDTGSTYTAFPCSGCSSCGEHTDKYWNESKSTSKEIPSCFVRGDQCHVDFVCKNEDNKCVLHESYKEKSSWDAFEVKDKTSIGDESIAANSDLPEPIDFTFACIYDETNALLFRRQKADGIMGMNRMSGTFVSTLKKFNAIEYEMFSLCFHSEGGTLVLGGTEPQLWEEPDSMVYARDPNYQHGRFSSFFNVHVVGIQIGSHKLRKSRITAAFSGGSIVDSGTTDTYFPASIDQEFRKVWKEAVGWEYTYADIVKLDKDGLAAMPSIKIIIEGENEDFEVEMLPDAYLDPYNDGYLVSIATTENMASGGILGANFMKNHDILFDNENPRIGFARANCKYAELQEKKKTTLCILKNEVVRVKTCNATCTDVTNTNSILYAMGYEQWADQYTDESDQECPPIETKPCPCAMNCGNRKAVISVDDFNEPIWLPCNVDCKQVKLSKKTDIGCTRVEERDCIKGNLCPEAHKGVIFRFVFKVLNKKKKSCGYWEKATHANALEETIATALGINIGQVELGETFRSTQSDPPECQLPIGLHFSNIYSKGADPFALAMESRDYIKTTEGANVLKNHVDEMFDVEMLNMSLIGFFSAESGDPLDENKCPGKVHWWIFGVSCILVLGVILMIKRRFFPPMEGSYQHPMPDGDSVSSDGFGADKTQDFEYYSPPSFASSEERGSAASPRGIQLHGASKLQESDFL